MENNGNKMKSTLFQLIYKVWTVHVTVIALYLFCVIILNYLVDEATMHVITSIICTLLYIVMCYLYGWRTGQRDHNLVKFGHIKYDRFKPLTAALLSQLIGIIPAVAAQASTDIGFLEKVYRWFCMDLVYLIDTVGQSVRALYFVPLIIAPIVLPLSYEWGYKEFRLLDKLMYRRPEKKKKQRDNPR